MDDPTISEKQRKAFEDEDVRSAFNVLDRDEIRKLLAEKISEIEKPFQVVFHDSYCVDCAEIGDVRLMVRSLFMNCYLLNIIIVTIYWLAPVPCWKL